MKQHGKYLDPSLPGIAYQMAFGARSVWAPAFDTRPQRKEGKNHG